MEFKLKSEFNFHVKKHNVTNNQLNYKNNIINNQQNFNFVVNNFQNVQEENPNINILTNLYYNQFPTYNYHNINRNNLLGNNSNQFPNLENKNYFGIINSEKNINNQNLNSLKNRKFINLMIVREIYYSVYKN